MKSAGMKTITDKKILAAVSGGEDSMCMLHKLGPNVVVAHFNHKMRGAESDRDAKFVEDWCNEHNLPFVLGEATGELTSEEEAREARYSFLERAALENGCDYIATAHTKDDNAETVLLNLTRGAGTKGLCGIPPERGNIIRPILDMTREEVVAYNAQHGIPHVDDSTNESDDYNRNLIRHKVLPVLKEINPRVVDAIFRTSQILRDDEDYFENGSERALQSRYIRANCPKPLTFDQVDAVLNLGGGYKQLNLPGIRVVKDRGKLFFEPVPPEFEVSVEEITVNSELTKDCIKCDSIHGSLQIGTRRPGDKLRCLGRNCTKTLKSLFLEADLTQAERDAWPVIRDDEGVIWVYNLAVAERVSAKPGDRAYKISVLEKNQNA